LLKIVRAGTASLDNCSLMDFLDKPVACCEEKTASKKTKRSRFGTAARVFTALFLISFSANAKPIPYKDGWMIMQENNTKENLLHVVYGLTPDFSAGLSSEWFKDKGYWLHSAQLNYLAYRNNEADAQTNVFLMSGAGAALKNDGRASCRVDWHVGRLGNAALVRLL